MSVRRKVFAVVSLVLVLVCIVLETGARLWVGQAAADGVGLSDSPRPGWGLPGMAVLDGFLLLTLVFTTAEAVGIPPRLVGRVRGVLTMVVSGLGCLGAIALLLAIVALLILMVSLLLAFPFGTAVYYAVFGHFDRSDAAVTLGVLMLLKLGALLALALHSMQTLKSKSLVVLFGCSIGLTLLVSFLHGLPPRPLVSITDAIGGIIAVAVGIAWAVYYFGGGLLSLARAFGGTGDGPDITAR